MEKPNTGKIYKQENTVNIQLPILIIITHLILLDALWRRKAG